MAVNEFGSVHDSFEVEGWIRDLLWKWFDTYNAEYERRRGKPQHYWPKPFAIESSSEFDSWQEDQLPHVVIISPGTNGDPVRRGDGSYEIPWLFTLAGIVYGATRSATRENQAALVTVLRWIMIQWKDLDHPEAVLANRWVDEDFQIVDSNDSRTLGAAAVTFEIIVGGVAIDLGGPPALDPLPGDQPYTTIPGPMPTVRPGQTYRDIFKQGER